MLGNGGDGGGGGYGDGWVTLGANDKVPDQRDKWQGDEGGGGLVIQWIAESARQGERQLAGFW